MSIYSRQIEREKLHDEISSDMVGSGNIVQSVYKEQNADFAQNKESPVVIVTSAGSARSLISASEGSGFWFNIHVFVRYQATNWTEAQAEDRLDEIEWRIAKLLKELSSSTKKYEIAGRSVAGSVVVGGEEYRREVIPVAVHAYSG